MCEVEKVGLSANLETDSLHALYHICMCPLQMYDSTEHLLKAGASVNQPDDKGWTPLASLLLHVNRGLRWHAYKVPELAKVDEMVHDKGAIENLCSDVDAEYQMQVRQCLFALLENGADVNAAVKVVPAVASSDQWIEKLS